jgi:hypothetical protein
MNDDMIEIVLPLESTDCEVSDFSNGVYVHLHTSTRGESHDSMYAALELYDAMSVIFTKHRASSKQTAECLKPIRMC